MPILDLPLAKLKSYKGSTPCPNDIDPYWDAALAEMRAVDPKVRLEKSGFQTETAEPGYTRNTCGRETPPPGIPRSSTSTATPGARATGATSSPTSPWASPSRPWTVAVRAEAPRT
jgi:hypothetical protein